MQLKHIATVTLDGHSLTQADAWRIAEGEEVAIALCSVGRGKSAADRAPADHPFAFRCAGHFARRIVFAGSAFSRRSPRISERGSVRIMGIAK